MDLDDLLNQMTPSLRRHSRRVALCSAVMAECAKDFAHQMYAVPTEVNFPAVLHFGGACHDIGKLLTPSISPEETAYQKHPGLGAALLQDNENIDIGDEASTIIVLDIVRHHHERPDGSGFPDGLTAQHIPLAAAICCLADTLDHYVYKIWEEGGNIQDAHPDIAAKQGTLFSASAVIIFDRAWPLLKEKYKKWPKEAR